MGGAIFWAAKSSFSGSGLTTKMPRGRCWCYIYVRSRRVIINIFYGTPIISHTAWHQARPWNLKVAGHVSPKRRRYTDSFWPLHTWYVWELFHFFLKKGWVVLCYACWSAVCCKKWVSMDLASRITTSTVQIWMRDIFEFFVIFLQIIFFCNTTAFF